MISSKLRLALSRRCGSVLGRALLMVGLGLVYSDAALAQATVKPPPETECQLRLATPSSVAYRGARSRGYEVFDNLRHQEQVQIVVLHAGAGCKYALVASSRNSPLHPQLEGVRGTALPYEVKEDGGGRNLLTPDYEGSSDTRIQGSFGEGVGSETHSLYVEVPPGELTRGGRYDDTVLFRLFRDDGGAFTLLDEKGMNVGLDVPSVVQASISGTGSRQTQVDFGDLKAGVSRSLEFTAQSNVDFRISLSSENAGRLKHDYADAYVPYRVQMNGRNLSLGLGGAVAAEVTGTAEERTYDFSVVIDGTDGRAPAGHYSDALTVTISSM